MDTQQVKQCPGCRADVPRSGYYRQRRGTPQTLCKTCHNRRCRERVATNPNYKANQMAAKRLWESRHPKRKRLHEGKPVLFAAGTPAGECEEMVRQLQRMSGKAWA